MQKGHGEVVRYSYSPFWICGVVFATLATDAGFRFERLVAQYKQLEKAELLVAQNSGRLNQMLSQRPQVEAKLQALSFDVLQISKTNNTARQIVQDFNIQWTPPATPAAAPAPGAAK